MSALVGITTRGGPPVRELTVISGKGGTGKTSIVASFAALAKNAVLADCDVDAADLHLVKPGSCTACGKCEELCRFDAIFFDGPGNGVLEKTFRVDTVACEGCGVCAWFCAEGAIEFGPVVNGEWFISETRCGPMVHARLGIAEENSGKLVSTVRTNAKRIAEERGLDLVLIDGSPGIGCPVIASVTGTTLVLAVTEPTLSGLHDLERVAQGTLRPRIYRGADSREGSRRIWAARVRSGSLRRLGHRRGPSEQLRASNWYGLNGTRESKMEVLVDCFQLEGKTSVSGRGLSS